jgi:predicted AlkP superfamily pyrophosphatase or phosphodiesterase
LKKKLLKCLAAVLFLSAASTGSEAQSLAGPLKRPKLVVGLVVDQMRWDFLYRYIDRYGTGGLRRLVETGFTCENTMIPYTPTVTACGHTSVYTGSVPAVHGIVGNSWYDKVTGKTVYCAGDSTVKTIGSNSTEGLMSPANMLSNTIGDELRIATNFQSRVVGIALKDRGSILPAGHAANAAFWYDGTVGKMISSSFYMNQLPTWVDSFNNQELPAKYIAKPWTTLYPIESYAMSTADDQSWEGRFAGETGSVFPHKLVGNQREPFEILASSPFGNTYTLEFAKKAIQGYKLGRDKYTDMLCVSISSTDYVGHQFGPNSIEAEDTYLRLDRDLASFFTYLDQTIGKDQYLLFLTADHGAMNAPGYLKEHHIPDGPFDTGLIGRKLDSALQQKYGTAKFVSSMDNYQVYLNNKLIESSGKNFEEVKAFAMQQLKQNADVSMVIDLAKIGTPALIEPLQMMVTNGFNAQRSGDIQVVLNPAHISGYARTGTGHGAFYPYDAHIPLVWMGWKVPKGKKTNRVTHMSDIAPSLAAMLKIQMPNGATGKPIEELVNP